MQSLYVHGPAAPLNVSDKARGGAPFLLKVRVCACLRVCQGACVSLMAGRSSCMDQVLVICSVLF